MRSLYIIFISIFILQNIVPISPVFAAHDEKIPSLPLYKISTAKNYHDGEVIITYKEKTTKEFQSITKRSLSDEETKKEISEQTKKISQSLKDSAKIDDLQIKDHINDLGISLVSSEKESTDDLIKKLKENDLVENVEPNYIKTPTYTPNDSYFYAQWAHYDSSDHDADITDAWDHESSSASNITVAVIDSGVDHDFADLSANMWDGSGSCFSDTGATISCPYHGWDYDDNDNDPDDTTNAVDGYQGHGTHAASIINATTNNASGMSGISRYNHVKVMALRFGLDTYSEIKAINFAKNNGAKVINASFAGEYYSTSEKNAIDAFSGIVVTAAGNGGDDEIGDNNDTTPLYPCNYSSSNIICVGATNDTDALTSFSNYGENVDITAPGESILGIQQGSYWYGSGTSFSSPLVAGTAGLLYAHNTSASISTVRNTLLQSSDHLTSISGKISCGRRLNVNTALQSVIANTIPTETCKMPIYRLYNTKTGAHVYARGITEKELTISTWPEFEFTDGVPAFYASLSAQTGLTPMYRIYNTKTGVHVYARGEADRDLTMRTWPEFEFTDGVPAFYASLSAQTGLTPMYRIYNTKTGVHVYARGEADRDLTMRTWPEFEFTDGVPAFYAQL